MPTPLHPLERLERQEWLRRQETADLLKFVDAEFNAGLNSVLGGLTGLTEVQLRSRLVRLKTLKEIKTQIQNGNNGNGSADKPNPTDVSDVAAA